MQDHPRKTSTCAHTIISKLDMIVVPNLSQDPRFKDFLSMTENPGSRFYASTPLICPEGFRQGSICVMDTKTRPEGLSLMEKQNLREIADMLVDAMVEHRESKNHEFRNPSQVIACTTSDLLSPSMGVVKGLSTI
jgi:GAF domain-containing protein